MRPKDIQTIGKELAIKWEDDQETFIPLETLRRRCPCASCHGETDIMGNVYKGPDTALPPTAFQLQKIVTVGGYALQPFWADGHSTGLFSFETLRNFPDSANPS